MSSDEDLRARLSQIDPFPTSVPVDPFTSPKSQDILKGVMATQIHEKNQKYSHGRWRKPSLLTAVAAAVVAFGIVALGVTSGGPINPTKGKTTLVLKLPGGGTSLQAGGITSTQSASCVGFSVPYLREVPMAFAGTVTAVSDRTVPTLSDMTVTLRVDHWYKGGTADVVTLTTLTSHALTPTTSAGVEDGVEFVQGKRYLVTATNGTVNGCGFTGEATPELEKAFAEAFGPATAATHPPSLVCPSSLAGVHPGSRLGQLVPSAPERVVFCKYAGSNEKVKYGTLIRFAAMLNPSTLAALLNQAKFVPDGSAYSCPIDFNALDAIVFLKAKKITTLVIHTWGCGWTASTNTSGTWRLSKAARSELRKLDPTISR